MWVFWGVFVCVGGYLYTHYIHIQIRLAVKLLSNKTAASQRSTAVDTDTADAGASTSNGGGGNLTGASNGTSNVEHLRPRALMLQGVAAFAIATQVCVFLCGFFVCVLFVLCMHGVCMVCAMCVQCVCLVYALCMPCVCIVCCGHHTWYTPVYISLHTQKYSPSHPPTQPPPTHTPNTPQVHVVESERTALLEESLSLLSTAATADPHDPIILYSHAVALAHARQLTQAIRTTRACIAASQGGHIGGWCLLGLLLGAQGRFGLAIQVLGAAVVELGGVVHPLVLQIMVCVLGF